MKQVISFFMAAVLCLSLIPLGCTATAEETFWTDGTLEYHGHTIDVHAIIQDTMPEELQQVTLKGHLIKKNVLFQTLPEYFTLHPDFKNYNPIDDFYFSAWAFIDGICLDGYESDFIQFCEVEQLFPIKDPTLSSIYDQCIAFLADLGITATKNVGYITHDEERNGKDYIKALIPYQIEGLSTEYKNQIVARDSLEYSSKTGSHIMDYPWAEFVFDSELQLVTVRMSSFQVASSKELSGTAISWEEAAISVLEFLVDDEVDFWKTVEHISDYDEEQFWADYRVQLVRALPMWMPNWRNVCIPGWCIQYQLYDAATGELVYAPSYCADALTGKVAY